MKEKVKSRFAGTGKINNQVNLEKQNVRTLMQAFHGCRKNCQECREEEQEWAKRTTIRCFYHSQNYACSFTTTDSQEMENHYRQKHYFEPKEVNHV